MIPEYEITSAEADVLLSREEGHGFDFKSRRISPSSLSKVISAFANADGGELLIGVEDDGTWEGFDDAEAANGHLQLFEQLFPLGHGYEYAFLRGESLPGLVLQVQVMKSRSIVKASDGVAYLRRGAQKLPQTTEEQLSRLRMNKGIESFVSQTVDAPLDRITNSEVVIGFMIDVVPSLEPERWLRSQQLIVGDKPTVAGELLFDDEPQVVLPKRSGIKLYRYHTRKAEGERETLAGDPITIEGCAYSQIYEAVDRTTAMISELKKLTHEGLVPVSYPPETLHEIITNAVLHRDYSIAKDIMIRVFDNRVEVESPGTLPGHVNRENILDEQFARNGVLVRLINRFTNPPNKDVGEGLNTAFNAMTKLRLRTPEIVESGDAVLVIIRHEALASAEDLVMSYLAKNPEINNSTGRELTGITSENSMKDVFYRLRDSGLIERVPDRGGNKAAWRLIE